MRLFKVISSVFGLLSLSRAQFPAPPTGLNISTSKVDDRVEISYKQTNICETTEGVKSYSGFVHLPGALLGDVGGYDINTYFIYFEARHNASTAPLAVYLAGGPGESSIYTALASESGPCYVNVKGTETTSNPWSFNNYVNMLYLDQPVQAGYSYDALVNGTFNLETQIITPQNFTAETLPGTNATFGIGTFASQDPGKTANTTATSAKALWHAAEHWLTSFPPYSTASNRLSVWGNSYGGFWGPETAALFSKRLRGLSAEHPLKQKNLTIDTVGITNGCIDFLYSMEGYPEFAFNNTYGVHFTTEALYHEAMDNITKSEGCLDAIKQCRRLGEVGDENFSGSNQTVNEACSVAVATCEGIIGAFGALNNRSAFDVAVHLPDPCPYYLPAASYLNRAEVQSALGVPLNFTYDSSVITAVFGFPTPYQILGTGDAFRQAGLRNVEYLLANDVQIAMVFGDRDYRCPWTGGEATAKAARWKNQQGFLAAGYEEIQGLSPAALGGVVKQYGRLSFSRVFDAGHAVSAYAPEAVYRIFMRSMFGKDVATGGQVAGCGYRTTGPTDSLGWRNRLPEDLPQTCMVAGQFQAVNPWEAAL